MTGEEAQHERREIAAQIVRERLRCQRRTRALLGRLYTLQTLCPHGAWEPNPWGRECLYCGHEEGSDA